jgi:hypothetical protein
MIMRIFMDMIMIMGHSPGMIMNMLVGLVFNGPVNAPEHIHQPEQYKGIGCQVAPDAFNAFDPGDNHPEGYPNGTKGNGTPDMAQATQEGDQRGPGQRPFPGFCNDHKGEIMIGPGKGMNYPDSCGRSHKYVYFRTHAAFN